jgi:hypothetical protein
MGGWFYLPHGVMTHHRDVDALGMPVPEAACGIEPADVNDWHGTGSQDEHDRVAYLAKCRRCVQEVAGWAETEVPKAVCSE